MIKLDSEYISSLEDGLYVCSSDGSHVVVMGIDREHGGSNFYPEVVLHCCNGGNFSYAKIADVRYWDNIDNVTKVI